MSTSIDSLIADDGVALAQAIRQQMISASAVVQSTLTRIQQYDSQLNCFTDVLGARAMATAHHIDRTLSQQGRLGALCGVPFGVKALFDIAGRVTLAGSIINRNHDPAETDATVIERLKQAGAVLVGPLNMDEYAYGFVTENAHYGSTHNPHAPDHIAGGSSGGSAAAVAAGLIAISLGTDTNGSVRIPAALCGIYGLKPTYGRLPRTGVTLLAHSLDHVGVLARSARDLATVFDFLQGSDHCDPVCSRHPPDPLQPQLGIGIQGLRFAIAGGYFREEAQAGVLSVVDELARVLGTNAQIILPQSERARAAAAVITAVEGAKQHWHDLQIRPQDFDPATRDRFLAGACVPTAWYLQAQQFRRWYRDRLRELWQHVDVLLAPTTPFPAPRLGQTTITVGGQEQVIRANLGRFTQPLSCVGLPVLSVPIQRPGQLPLGVQLIAAPYKESALLRVAAHLEAQGHIAAPIAKLEA
ncbi:MAG: AtzE family amidohydrolase [Spirulina sp. SIO3F2]|nr:AtzE family amidohydrolase [Spirulina sp. SIO3F2]